MQNRVKRVTSTFYLKVSTRKGDTGEKKGSLGVFCRSDEFHLTDHRQILVPHRDRFKSNYVISSK